LAGRFLWPGLQVENLTDDEDVECDVQEIHQLLDEEAEPGCTSREFVLK